MTYDQIDEILQHVKMNTDATKFVNSFRCQRLLFDYSDIVYFASYNAPHSRIRIRMENKNLPYNSSIKMLCIIVPEYFIKCSSSYLVNLHFVYTYDPKTHEVLLKTGERIPVSARNVSKVRAKLNEFHGGK